MAKSGYDSFLKDFMKPAKGTRITDGGAPPLTAARPKPKPITTAHRTRKNTGGYGDAFPDGGYPPGPMPGGYGQGGYPAGMMGPMPGAPGGSPADYGQGGYPAGRTPRMGPTGPMPMGPGGYPNGMMDQQDPVAAMMRMIAAMRRGGGR